MVLTGFGGKLFVTIINASLFELFDPDELDDGLANGF